jgi:hypothetical protein
LRVRPSSARGGEGTWPSAARVQRSGTALRIAPAVPAAGGAISIAVGPTPSAARSPGVSPARTGVMTGQQKVLRPRDTRRTGPALATSVAVAGAAAARAAPAARVARRTRIARRTRRTRRRIRTRRVARGGAKVGQVEGAEARAGPCPTLGLISTAPGRETRRLRVYFGDPGVPCGEMVIPSWSFQCPSRGTRLRPCADGREMPWGPRDSCPRPAAARERRSRRPAGVPFETWLHVVAWLGPGHVSFGGFWAHRLPYRDRRHQCV